MSLLRSFYTLGIDPGKSGAAVLLDVNVEGGSFSEKTIDINGADIYQGDELHQLMEELIDCPYKRPKIIVIEKVHAFSGQGVTSTFNFGSYYGRALFIQEYFAHETQPEQPRPQEWQKEMFTTQVFKENKRGERKLDTKESSRQTAIAFVKALPKQHSGEPFNVEIELLAAMKRKKDHGVSDALLLALWGARNF